MGSTVGSPDAFLKAVAGLKGFMSLTSVNTPEFRSSNPDDLQLLVNRATTALHFYLAERAFGENPFEQMRDELAKIASMKPMTPPRPDIPTWDRAARTLTFRGVLIRDFRTKEAPVQESILDQFQKAGWTRSVKLIPDKKNRPERPQPGEIVFDQKKLGDAVRTLNQGVEPKMIQFKQDGTGEGVAWGVVISG